MENSGGIQASLSGRYATALFELARDSKALTQVEASLGNVRKALDESPTFRLLVASPVVSRGDATRTVAALAGELDGYRVAVESLAATQGPDPSRWRWGSRSASCR